MSSIYTDGAYLETTRTWHTEDSPWKAQQVVRMIRNNDLHPNTIAELGCGAGAILAELSEQASLRDARFRGYDISPQAIELCRQHESDRLTFSCQDLLSEGNSETFDLLLVIDVFEHVPDYMGFLEKCRGKSRHQIYHIPLDIHVSSVMRNVFSRGRYTLGHLHYFTADSALATLKDTGHEIIDYFYTAASFELIGRHPSVKRAIANVPRWLISRFSVPLAARMFGGYSLLVLTK